MFRLAIDPKRRLIRSWFEGFLTIEEVMEWSRQEQVAVIALGCQSREFLLLVDTSGCALQSQNVVALFQQLVAKSKYKARRIAIMQGSSLTKMQIRRIVAGTDYIRHFEDTSDAEQWLFADEPSDIASPTDAAVAR